MRKQQCWVLAIATGALLLVGGCSGGTNSSDSTVATTSATSTSATTSSPTPTSPDPDAPEVRAEAALREYFRVHDACMHDPTKSKPTCFDKVAVSSALEDLRNGLSASQAAHSRQIGDSKVVTVKQTKIDLTNKPKETPPSIPTVTFSVCYDVSDVNIVDYKGRSLVPADRRPRGVETIGVVNYEYPDPAGWRVGFTEATSKSC